MESKKKNEVKKEIDTGKYRPTPDDRVLGAVEIISVVWPGSPPDGHLHVFVALPGGVGGTTLDGECFIWLMLSFGCFHSNHRPPNTIDQRLFKHPCSSTPSQSQLLLPPPFEHYSYPYSLHSHDHISISRLIFAKRYSHSII